MSIIAFYTGASGMRAYQQGLDVVSHNIANVQTTGYKARRATFEDLLYSRMNTNVAGDHLVGHGVKQGYIDQLMTQSGFDQTLHTLDFAINGNAFFQVNNGGQLEYTRNGSFSLSVENNGTYLVTNDGAYVLDRQGNRIALTEDENGGLTTDDLYDRIGLYIFDNQWGLDAHNNSRFTESANSGTPRLVLPNTFANGGNIDLVQGSLEFSGVDLGNEMINVIMYQRAFQMSSRVLQTADQIAEEVNNLR